jgi:hypothetical protein
MGTRALQWGTGALDLDIGLPVESLYTDRFKSRGLFRIGNLGRIDLAFCDRKHATR